MVVSRIASTLNDADGLVSKDETGLATRLQTKVTMDIGTTDSGRKDTYANLMWLRFRIWCLFQSERSYR